MIENYTFRLMWGIAVIGLVPSIAWIAECGDALWLESVSPYLHERCFHPLEYVEIGAGIMLSLGTIVFWLKRKKQICDCGS